MTPDHPLYPFRECAGCGEWFEKPSWGSTRRYCTDKCKDRNPTSRQKKQDAEYQKRWREENPDYHKKWRDQNPGYMAEAKNRRRARMRDNGVFHITKKDLNRLLSTPCRCGNPKVEEDHIIPIARGGRHSIGNLQPLCRTCNASKHDRLMSDWRIRGEVPEGQRSG